MSTGPRRMCSLECYLQAFDGTSVSTLSEARVACGNAPGYLDEVTALCADARGAVSQGATWILKAELEDGADLTGEQLDQLLEGLSGVVEWPAVLHVLQSVDYLKVSEEQASALVVWAAGYAGHTRPFVRAWSLSARVVLARRFPELQAEAARALRDAEDDPAASVRARVRQLQQ